MSDNPNDELDSVELDILTDKNAFLADIEAMKQGTVGFGAAAAESMNEAAAAAQVASDKFKAFNADTEARLQFIKEESDQGRILTDITQEQTAAIQDQINKTNELTSAVQDEQNVASGGVGPNLARLRGSNAGAGVDINEQPDVNDIVPPESGGAMPGAFGLSRGFRAAGQLATRGGSPELGGAFQVAGEGILVSNLFGQLSSALVGLNASLEATPGFVGAFAGALEALGLPMAGILAVALPIAAGLAAIAIGLNQIAASQKEARDQLDATLKTQTDYFKFAATATTEDAEKKKESLEQQRGPAQKALEENEAAIVRFGHQTNLLAADINHLSDLAHPDQFKSLVTALPAALGGDEVRKFYKGMEDAQASLGETDVFLGRLEGGLKNNAFAANDAAAAANKANEATLKKIETDARLAAQFAGDDMLTKDAAEKKVAALKSDYDAQQIAIDQLNDLSQAQGLSEAQVKANKEALEQHQQAQEADAQEITHLTAVSYDLIDARKLESDNIKQVEASAKATAKAMAEAAAIEAKLADDIENVRAKELNAEQQYTQGSLQDTQARLDIATKEARDEEKIKLDSYQRTVDLGTKLSENEAKAATDFDRQVQDDHTKLNQSREKLIRDAQATEQTNLEDHLAKLAQIHADRGVQDQQALLDRNFLQLAKNQQSNQTQIDAENARYATQERHQQEALQKQLRDQDIAEQQLEAQQRIAYVRKIQDLQTADNQAVLQEETAERRKLDVARVHQQQAIQDLVTNENYRIQLLREGMRQELDLLQQQEYQRLSVIRSGGDNTGPVGPGGIKAAPTAFASGGDTDDPFIFNELGSSGMERVKIGSQSFGSNTAALVIPFGPAHIDSGKDKRAVNVYNTWQISGSSNPEAIVNYAISEMQKQLEGMLK